MLKFEDFAKTLDPSTKVEIYVSTQSGIADRLLYSGSIKNLKILPDAILKIIPQRNSREVYLEIYAY
jgi:hypothetical protein